MVLCKILICNRLFAIKHSFSTLYYNTLYFCVIYTSVIHCINCIVLHYMYTKNFLICQDQKTCFKKENNCHHDNPILKSLLLFFWILLTNHSSSTIIKKANKNAAKVVGNLNGRVTFGRAANQPILYYILIISNEKGFVNT